MTKNTIKLTESQLHQVIKESVQKILSEIGDTKYGQTKLGAVAARAKDRGDKETSLEAFKTAKKHQKGDKEMRRRFKNGFSLQTLDDKVEE